MEHLILESKRQTDLIDYKEPCFIKLHFRTFGNMFASLTFSGSVSVWQLNASACNKNVPEVIKLHTLRMVLPCLKAVTIWGNGTIQVMDIF
jgi:hypothetical protein